MIASQAFTYEHVKARLEALNCKEVVNKIFVGKTQPYAVWETPWGHRFMVPQVVCTIWELDRIIERDVTKRKPVAH